MVERWVVMTVVWNAAMMAVLKVEKRAEKLVAL